MVFLLHCHYVTAYISIEWCYFKLAWTFEPFDIIIYFNSFIHNHVIGAGAKLYTFAYLFVLRIQKSNKPPKTDLQLTYWTNSISDTLILSQSRSPFTISTILICNRIFVVSKFVVSRHVAGTGRAGRRGRSQQDAWAPAAAARRAAWWLSNAANILLVI